MTLSITTKQQEFINARAAEVLFGGAAGGGKSYGQIVDAFLYALKYAGSKQLLLRRTLPELEKSLIRTALTLYPRIVYKYTASKHVLEFINGSLLDFGYCDSENDVYRYQSAEYDVIRFDELTHFTEQMYLYLMSRLRGANSFPKQIKSTTNPGGVGHAWVKARFIDIGPPGKEHTIRQKSDIPAEQGKSERTGSRIFIQSYVHDNRFLMENDPGYVTRLKNLSASDRRALYEGNWDVFEGQYFTEWDRQVHVREPFPIPTHWRVYRTIDYGLDMTACYWIAVDPAGKGYVFRELYQSRLIVSDAARRIKEMSPEPVYQTLAPPDLWNARQETGMSVADIFYKEGIPLTKTNNNRIGGWLQIKEWLAPYTDEQGILTARLTVFSSCLNLIRTLPALQHSRINPSDTATEPHELTHAPDAIRYFCIYWTTPADKLTSRRTEEWHKSFQDDYNSAAPNQRDELLKRYGNPFDREI